VSPLLESESYVFGILAGQRALNVLTRPYTFSYTPMTWRKFSYAYGAQ